MNSTLKMLLPTTLPRAMSAWPESAAPTLTASSGALVPNATTVSPTTSGEMPKPTASREAPRTSSSAPATRMMRPIMNLARVSGSICTPPRERWPSRFEASADYFGLQPPIQLAGFGSKSYPISSGSSG